MLMILLMLVAARRTTCRWVFEAARLVLQRGWCCMVGRLQLPDLLAAAHASCGAARAGHCCWALLCLPCALTVHTPRHSHSACPPAAGAVDEGSGEERPLLGDAHVLPAHCGGGPAGSGGLQATGAAAMGVGLQPDGGGSQQPLLATAWLIFQVSCSRQHAACCAMGQQQ